MEAISLVGIIVGLVLLMVLAFRGCSIVWIAPLCAMLVAVMGGMRLITTYMGDYMSGAANYVLSWFPAFFLGAVYGKILDMTGAARSLGSKLVQLIGSRFAVAAVVIPCLLMTYGGISLFVVVFVIYPMGYAIYREADLPRRLLPGAIAYGAFGITMTAIPGTPQVQNIIPTTFYGTTPTAAPLMSIVAALVIGVPGFIYLNWRASKTRAAGEHFTEDPKFKEPEHAGDLPSWHWITGLVPLLVVILVMNGWPWMQKNVLGTPEDLIWNSSQAIVIALIFGIIVALLLNINQFKVFVPAINEGANGSLIAIMNTSCAVGFGSVVKVVPGFSILKNLALNMPGSILFSEAVAVNLLAGATGSASGGMSIALEALGPTYLQKAHEIGMNPEYLHRIASLSSGGLDSLPHNGAVLTLLAISNCTHKESYWDVCVTTVIIPVVMSLVLALVWGLF